MKILVLDIYYSNFLDSYYKNNISVKNFSYADQKTDLFKQFFGTADFYSKNLKPLGVVAEEIIINDEVLQKQWAKENQVKYFPGLWTKIPKVRRLFPSNWSTKILAKQIEQFQPDVLYCQSLYSPTADFLKTIKKHVKLIVGQVASPVEFDKNYLQIFDLITTSFPHFVKKFQSLGIKSEYFKIGFESTILNILEPKNEKYESVFVGGFSRHHQAAIELFEYLADNCQVDFWGYGAKKLNPSSPILKTHHGEVWGINMYQILNQSKISINRHIATAKNYANNMRLYESTGVGTMLLTDHKDNLQELFEIDKEIVTYNSKEELVEKVHYYLTHDDQRKQIAKNGQARTLRDHAYAIRMKELLTILNKYL